MGDEPNKPIVAAGANLIDRCPFSDCQKRYQESVATDIKHKCPACDRYFTVNSYQS